MRSIPLHVQRAQGNTSHAGETTGSQMLQPPAKEDRALDSSEESPPASKSRKREGREKGDLEAGEKRLLCT